MKIFGKFQILDERSTALSLDPALAQAMSIADGSLLYAASLDYLASNRSRGRKMMLVATTLPEKSWHRLVRVAISLDIVRGGLFKVVAALSQLKLYCRYIEEIAGARLERTPLLVGAQSVSASLDDDILLPSVLLVLELPNSSSITLHSELAKLFEETSRDKSRAREMLTDELRIRLNERTVPHSDGESRSRPPNRTRVHWISPMTTLYRLSYPDRTRADRVRVTSGEKGAMSINLLPWRHFLWGRNGHEELPPTSGGSQGRNKVFVLSTVDSDEQVICWHFYDYANYLVVEFDMVVPAFGLEQIWWEYIFDCVQEAQGWIMSTHNSSRFDGCWSTLHTVALFPLDPLGKPDEAVRRIVGCFRYLQGRESYSKRFDELTKRLAQAREDVGPDIILTPENLKRWRVRNDTAKSRLEKVVVWDPEANGTGSRYSPDLFAPNPFNFTIPLELKSYTRIYGSGELGRRRLADRIVEQISRGPRENFAVVGAHRTGKTTVLNLVYDRLDQEWRKDKKLLPIRINASVTPPHIVFVDVVERLKKELAGKAKALSYLRAATTRMQHVARNVVSATTFKGAHLEVKGEDLLKEDVSSSDLRSLLARVKEPRALPEFLKMALHEIQRTLSLAGGVRSLIVIDELSDSTLWGSHRIFAVWRHAIESSGFESLSWLISTSRPIEETARYSPITNVLRELNVGPLEADEANLLIDAFSIATWRHEYGLQQSQRNSRLRPVITHLARNFLIEITNRLPYLLQVACYHLYDRATRSDFPLINKSLCRKVLLSRVLPEMSDYLEHQWGQINPEAQRFVKDSLREPYLPKDCRQPDEFLQNLGRWQGSKAILPPSSRKSLERSGLRGNDEAGPCVAPLVAAWLLSDSNE